MKTRSFSVFILIALLGSIWATAYAGTVPNQSANLANVNTSCVSPVEAPTPTPSPTSNCKVGYIVTLAWCNYFTGCVTIQNTGKSAIKGWTLRWAYSGNQTITTVSNGYPQQSGKVVNITNADCNKTIPAGGTATFTFLACYSGTNTNPTVFTLQ